MPTAAGVRDGWRSPAGAPDPRIPAFGPAIATSRRPQRGLGGRRLSWYPLDFTFVCPTEIRGFQEALGDFQDDGVAVIGVSTDSFFSHEARFADRSR